MRLWRPPGDWRSIATVAVVLAAGAAITALLLPPERPDPTSIPPLAIRVAGTPLPTLGDPVGQALDLVRRYAGGEIAVTLPDGSSKALKRASLGVEIDRVRLAEFIREALRPDSPLRRAHEARSPGAPLDVPLPVTVDTDVAVGKLLDLKAELDAPATDAFVDLEQRKLRAERSGHRLDVFGTLARIDAALRSGADAVAAVAETIAPRLAAAALHDVKFDRVLGWFETRYAQGARSRDRTYNLRQAASKLDGAVILPGELFDFNATVGPRDEAHGYRVAPVIAQGELVDGLGGGTCQISGTLHGAAFFAGLDIVERSPHSRPSYYIKLGLDATVVYPTINYRFRNPFDFPIVLHETVAGGVVRAEILGPARRHTVTFFRRIDEVVPFEGVERKTDRLPEGARVLVQRGIPGFRITSSRVVRDGAYAIREKWTDNYPPTSELVNVGTGPKDLESKAVDDPHPEYVVDEYLVTTQGPDVRTPGMTEPEPAGGTVERREPGRTGRYGWTEKAGMSRFRSSGDVEQIMGVAPAEGEASLAAKAARDDGQEAKASKDDAAEHPRKRKRKKKPGAE